MYGTIHGFLNLLRSLLFAGLADGLDDLVLVRDVHQRQQMRKRHNLVLLWHALECLGHRGQLLRPEGRRAGHITQRDLQPGSLHIVCHHGHSRQRISGRSIQHNRPIRLEHVTLNRHCLVLTAAQIINDHRQQQLAHLRPSRTEVVHQIGQALCALLDLCRLLQPGCRVTALPLEAGRDPAGTLNGHAGVLQHLVLLFVQLEIPLDLECGTRLGHVLGVQHDVSINPGCLSAVDVIVIRQSALCTDGARCSQAPADLADGAIHVVLLVHHAAHHAIGHARPVLALAPERHIGEMVVAVWGWTVVQLVRTHPERHPHLGNQGGFCANHAGRHQNTVRRVVAVKLHHAAIGGSQDRGPHPAPIPHFMQANAVPLRVAPLLLLNAPSALIVDRLHQRCHGAAIGQDVQFSGAAHGHIDQVFLPRKPLLGDAYIHPLLANQVSGIRQIVFLRQHVPEDFIAVDGRASVGILERVAVLTDFYPAHADTQLRLECLRARPVCARRTLRLVQLVVQCLGDILAFIVNAIGRYTPVRAGLGLKPQYRLDRWADDRLNGRRNPVGLHQRQDFRIELVAVHVVHFTVGLVSPSRLVLNLIDPFAVRFKRQGLIAVLISGG